MGILLVLILWAVVGSILAAIGALIAGGLGWAAVIFVFQAMVSGTVLDRDMGLGDTWHCSVPNGFAITMIDVTDHGEEYNKARTTDSGFTKEEDSVYGVKF